MQSRTLCMSCSINRMTGLSGEKVWNAKISFETVLCWAWTAVTMTRDSSLSLIIAWTSKSWGQRVKRIRLWRIWREKRQKFCRNCIQTAGGQDCNSCLKLLELLEGSKDKKHIRHLSRPFCKISRPWERHENEAALWDLREVTLKEAFTTGHLFGHLFGHLLCNLESQECFYLWKKQ